MSKEPDTDRFTKTEVAAFKASTVIQFLVGLLVGALVWIAQGMKTDLEAVKADISIIKQRDAIVTVLKSDMDSMKAELVAASRLSALVTVNSKIIEKLEARLEKLEQRRTTP